jgi:hypothetical protein
MSRPPSRRSYGWIGWLIAGAVVGGLTWHELSKPRPPAPPPTDGTITRDAAPHLPADAPTPADAPPPAPLYTVTEALDDVAAAPLKLIGTGKWPGLETYHACAYQNDRVIVVNVYCSAREAPAVDVIVMSRTRGRVSIYAEAGVEISTVSRADYIDFTLAVGPVFSEPVPATSYAALRAWEQRHYDAMMPTCAAQRGGTQCAPKLAAGLAAWSADADPFIAAPPPAWYKLVKAFHARAVRDSQHRSE